MTQIIKAFGNTFNVNLNRPYVKTEEVTSKKYNKEMQRTFFYNVWFEFFVNESTIKVVRHVKHSLISDECIKQQEKLQAIDYYNRNINNLKVQFPTLKMFLDHIDSDLVEESKQVQFFEIDNNKQNQDY